MLDLAASRDGANGNDLALSGGIGATGAKGILAAPAVPATGVVRRNDFPFDVTIYVSGGTVTLILIDNALTGLTSGTFRVRPGGSFQLNYTVAPTWVWARR